jgi:hypothetical protein
MFGYITIDPRALSKEGKIRYREYYCGLCHQLYAQYGRIGRATLTYDMTFLAILLSALYGGEDESCGNQRCAVHPLRPQPYRQTSATAYAADMNILLAYYQRLDDWYDDHNPVAREKSLKLTQYLPRIKEAHPYQYKMIAGSMARLGEMEKANELNPDKPANCFGELMGSLFVWRQDTYTDTLWRMGAALGRFIYLLDAVNDKKADIKKQRYNPLVAQMETDFTPMLILMMGECTAAFESLPIEQDVDILQNILYSGVWQKYRVRRKKGVDA